MLQVSIVRYESIFQVSPISVIVCRQLINDASVDKKGTWNTLTTSGQNCVEVRNMADSLRT